MALSSDNIKTIKHFADKLEEWAENLSYSVRPPGNLWMQLTLSLRPQNVQGFTSWLADISKSGQKAGKALTELSRLVQEVDAWRNHGVYPEDLGEFCARINRLMKVTRNIISILRSMSGSGKPELSETKTKTVEKSNPPDKPERASNIAIASSQEALMAYKLHCEMGLTIQQIAKKMTAELKLDKALRPWQISRWIKQAESLHKRSSIHIRSFAPGASETIERSAKTDAAKT